MMAILIELLATFVIDLGARLGQKMGWITPMNISYFGRWIFHLCQGKNDFKNIASARPFQFEKNLGYIVHYSIGGVFSLGYWYASQIFGFSLVDAKSILAFVLLTCLAPWTLMFPLMGFGFFARKSPRLVATSSYNHATYGAAVCFGFWLFQIISK